MCPGHDGMKLMEVIVDNVVHVGAKGVKCHTGIQGPQGPKGDQGAKRETKEQCEIQASQDKLVKPELPEKMVRMVPRDK